jgi:quinol monooxygenase YgiN/uncharacterized protein YndB with AHSA1/START domain
MTTVEMEQWWGSPDVYRITDWNADFRVGGRWSLLVRLPDGNAMPASGTFIEIDAPRKLKLTRRYDWPHPTLGSAETSVTYQLDAIETGTRLVVRHDAFNGRREAAFEHAAGWERLMGWLGAYLSPAQDEISGIVQSFRAELRDPTQPLALMVRFEVRPAEGDRIEAEFARALPHTLGEAGCLLFEVSREATRSNRFVVYERWRSLADLEAHLRTASVLSLRAQIAAALVGPPEFNVLTPASR